MPFNIVSFIAGRAVAESAGVDRERATQLAILPGVLNVPLAIGLITARAIAQREAEAAAPAQPGTPPTPVLGQPAPILIPSVVGQTQDQATTALRDAGFTNVTTLQEPSSAEDKGKVIDQIPAAGGSIQADDPIVLTIGQGLPCIDVPDVTSLPLEIAIELLKDNGLTYGIKGHEQSDLPLNTIIRQEPGSGTSVEQGTKVELTLSKGPSSDEPE